MANLVSDDRFTTHFAQVNIATEIDPRGDDDKKPLFFSSIRSVCFACFCAIPEMECLAIVSGLAVRCSRLL